jgi:hypothetical protein
MRHRNCLTSRIARGLALAAAGLVGAAAQRTSAQTAPAPQQQPASLSTVLHESAPPSSPASLATVSTEGVSLSGPLSVADGRAFLGNNDAITAGDKTARVALTRGGSLNVCASTQIHLSTDTAISGGGFMIALDRGAIEGHYLPSQYSDVVLTPDLRILISGPGTADFSLRVSSQGDTCIDNHGDHAPTILATNLFEGGAYRVQPNQRVLFVHGSLQQVVDNEKESCGCPPPEPAPTPTAIARIGEPGMTPHSANPTAAQNPFPLAESEGLQPPPPPPSKPVVPPGEVHAQVTAPLVYSGEAAPSTEAATKQPETQAIPAAPQTTPPASQPAAARKHSAFVRFFRRIFGRR